MIKLYPTPKKAELKKGSFCFDYVRTEALPYEILEEEIRQYGITEVNDKEVNVKYVKKESLTEEAYEIHIAENGALVYYADLGGALYATQTLCQLINMKEVQYLEIYDEPSIKRRILSFDISRGKIPTMEHFKEVIDHAAKARYNVLVLYLDRLVVQLPSFEKYWLKDAVTVEEMHTLKKWCNEKNIQLSLSVETFGHLNHFLEIEEFKHLSNAIDENVKCGDLNPLDPGSLEFVDRLIGDVIPFIDTEFIKIGGDEIRTLATGKSKEEVEKNGTVAVYMEYMQKVCNICTEKYHKIPMLPNDMFMHIKNSEKENLESLKIFPKNAIIDDWGYESEYEYHNFDKHADLFEKMKIPFATAASTGLYNQYIQRTYNMSLNALNSCAAALKHGAYGVIQTTWGDTGNSQFMCMEYEGLYVFGQTAWRPDKFQVSDVLGYMDKYVFKSQKGSIANVLAEIGDCAWFSKGKFPNAHTYTFADSGSFTDPLIWNSYHAHAGIDRIYIWDAVDEYGCEKAIKHIDKITEELKNTETGMKNGDTVKEKILLNFLMFETTIKSAYMKLCLLALDEEERAKKLSKEVMSGYDCILENYKKLWLTENRENGSEIFLNFIKKKRDELIDWQNMHI